MKSPFKFGMSLLTALSLLTSPYAMTAAKAQGGDKFGPYRGLNVQSYVTDDDLKHAKDSGANLIRLTFSDDPLENKAYPYKWNPTAFYKLDHLVAMCGALGLKVVIDPHTSPGCTSSNDTMSIHDPFWDNLMYSDLLIATWKAISDRYKTNGTVVGYDLLNEPSIKAGYNPNTAPDPKNPADWNALVGKLVKTIRSNGDNHWIIVETQAGNGYNRLKGVELLKLPADNRIVVSPHMYEPHKFTYNDNPPKPGDNSSEPCPSDQEIASYLLPVVQFKTAHPNIPIWIGEFSAKIYGGTTTDQFVGRVIEQMEGNGWNWNYHAFRAAQCWDAELPVGIGAKKLSEELADGRVHRSGNTPRMQTLKHYFNRN